VKYRRSGKNIEKAEIRDLRKLKGHTEKFRGDAWKILRDPREMQKDPQQEIQGNAREI
jgi:hypothetical protein